MGISTLSDQSMFLNAPLRSIQAKDSKVPKAFDNISYSDLDLLSGELLLFICWTLANKS